MIGRNKSSNAFRQKAEAMPLVVRQYGNVACFRENGFFSCRNSKAQLVIYAFSKLGEVDAAHRKLHGIKLHDSAGRKLFNAVLEAGSKIGRKGQRNAQGVPIAVGIVLQQDAPHQRNMCLLERKVDNGCMNELGECRQRSGGHSGFFRQHMP